MIWVYSFIGLVILIGAGVFFGAPYVPSHRKDIRRLFEKGVPLSTDDVVLDIGSGDGVVLREASRRGARAIGYEIHPLFVTISRVLSWHDSRVKVRWANAWTAPFPDDVTLVYIFSVHRDGKRLVKKMQREAVRLGRTLTLVCYGNELPEEKPFKTFEAYHIYRFTP